MPEGDVVDRRGRWRILALALAVGLVGFGACGRTPAEDADGAGNLDVGSYENVDHSDEAPRTGGYLRYGLPAETNSYNPGLAQWGAHSMQVARAIFDPLFEYDEDGEVHPFLLERAEHNEDYTEWTLVLRDNITFHNGRKMTATDLSRVSAQLMASEVVGAAWAINDLSGARIVDDRTLVVQSTKPWVTLPHQSASQLGFVPDPDWMESPDWEHPVGSGPFKVDRWAPGTELSLKRNPDYWRTDGRGVRLPYLDRVDFEIIPDDSDRLDLLRRGALDVLMQTAPGPAAAQLISTARDGEIQLVTENRDETPEDFVLLNTMRPPFTDVATRRGLATAIDRQAASQYLSQGVNPPADGMYEPSSPWYVPTSYPNYDPAQARTLLDRAIVRDGKPLSFVLKGPDTPEGLRAMNFVRDQLAKVGVEVRLEGVQLSQMLITMLQGNFDALILQHFDYPNPAPEMVFVNPAQVKPIGEFTLSLSRVTDAGITGAIDGALHSLDPAARKNATALLQQRLGEIVPYLWLVHGRRHIAARNGIVNLVNHTLPDGAPGMDFLLGSHRLDQAWLRSAR
jgi:peptide/nickel transport system substrate-binding protein